MLSCGSDWNMYDKMGQFLPNGAIGAPGGGSKICKTTWGFLPKEPSCQFLKRSAQFFLEIAVEENKTINALLANKKKDLIKLVLNIHM